MHRVSVIVPCFNNGVFLRDCVCSIRENSAGVEVEIIVVDDGSTDEKTVAVVGQLDPGPDLKVIRHEKNRGVQAARNTGLEAATSHFVLTVDGDDVMLPLEGHESFLSEAARILSANDNIAFVHTLVKMHGDFEGLTISSFPLREELIVRKHHVPISIVYRRSEISNGLRYLETVRKWQDWAFGITLLSQRWRRNEGSGIAFVEGPGFGYRIHSTSPRISLSQVSEYEATKVVVGAHWDYFVSKLPDVAHDIDSLTAAVVASKPSPLEDLLSVASYKLELALNMARGREYQLNSAHVDRLGIP